MPYLLAGLASLLGSLIPKILFALGIGFISYQGADVLISHVTTYIAAQLSFNGGQFPDLWQMFGCQIMLNMILSAYSTKLTLIGATKLVMKPAAV